MSGMERLTDEECRSDHGREPNSAVPVGSKSISKLFLVLRS